jgi:adenylate cyclase
MVASQGMPESFIQWAREGYRPAPGSRQEQLLQGAEFVHVADIRTSAENPTNKASVDAGTRTLLMVPLRKDETLLGFLTGVRQEVRPFTGKQIALLQNFAAQAVIAMENARLITETREALEQQTATAEVLGVINSSPGDLAPVFEAVLEKALRLSGASNGALVTYDGEFFQAVASRGNATGFEEIVRQPYRPHAVHMPLLHGERYVHIPDVATAFPDWAGAVVGGFCTLLAVPLRKDGRLLGFLAANRREVQAFSDKEVALVENFAAQAVIAMENARLITETREALEQQTATAEVLQVINASPGDLAPVFDAILEKAHALCGAEIGSLTIYDGEENRAVATRGLTPGFADRLRQGFRPGPAHPIQKLLSGVRIVQVSDVGESADPLARDSFEAGIRTALYVPLRKDSRLLGLIVASRQEVRLFSDKEITLLENFAAQAVIAMENARLLGELRQRTDEVAELNRGLEARVAEQVDELSRVGRLKRFLAPQLAELIVSQGDEKILESHRREIVVVFCDLRGYTAFTETAEPEEVLEFLRQYHGALGPLVSQYEGTLDQFSGDGIMVFFNDPVPCPDPAERAVKMAVAMRSAADTLIADWRERGRDLGFGAGIAQGYATLGQIGFSERSGYTAIGTVCNVAARLCAEAKDGQILLSQRVNVALKGGVATEQVGALALKGLTQPVVAYNVPLGAIQPVFRVIEGGDPQTV